MLISDLGNVQSATNAVFRQPVHIPVVVIPVEIRLSKTKTVIAEAILEIHFSSKDLLQLLEMKNVHSLDIAI